MFRIKFKIPILDLMLLPKSVPFEGLYYSSGTVPSSNTVVLEPKKGSSLGVLFYIDFS